MFYGCTIIPLKVFDKLINHYLTTGEKLNRFLHYRSLDSIFLPIVRQNRDTLYSLAILDTVSGPLTIELANTDGRYQSVYCINQNHFQEYYATAPAAFKVIFIYCVNSEITSSLARTAVCVDTLRLLHCQNSGF